MLKDYTDLLDKLSEKPDRGLNDQVLIIDAMNMLIRSFALIKSMNPEGHHTGGLVGFLRSLAYMVRLHDPTRTIVVWDGKGGSSNRKNMNTNYKAQRATSRITHWGLYETKVEESEALIAQLYKVQDYLELLPVHQIMMEKLEADDIIAYLANNASANGKKVTIVSSDKDFLQLVGNGITVYSPIRKVLLDSSNIKEELKVLPENYNIVKALQGDKSDNVEGIKGVGIKTIVFAFPALVTNPNATLDYVYDICESKLGTRKIFAEIIDNWDRVENNYKLMDLHETMLDEKEKAHILTVLKEEVPSLEISMFLHRLQEDGIEGITQNTEAWLGNFSSLVTFSNPE